MLALAEVDATQLGWLSKAKAVMAPADDLGSLGGRCQAARRLAWRQKRRARRHPGEHSAYASASSRDVRALSSFATPVTASSSQSADAASSLGWKKRMSPNVRVNATKFARALPDRTCGSAAVAFGLALSIA